MAKTPANSVGMVKTNLCQLWLACADKGEADKVVNALLVKHLIACGKQIPVSSDYLWQGKIKSSKEVLLLMESKMDLFDKVEQEVKKLHSYDTFVLEAVSVDNISARACKWLKENTKNG